jgi:hypothetical protein
MTRRAASRWRGDLSDQAAVLGTYGGVVRVASGPRRSELSAG